MQKIDCTLPTPAENLAFDEVLLDLAEEGKSGETLRFWEPKDYFVVLGYSNKRSAELRNDGIPILRRSSGGGAVVQGPGCLNYALILKIQGNVTQTNRLVMEKNRQALEKILKHKVTVEGHTDLVTDSMKFSGNAQRRKRHYLLFHGTFLIDFDFSWIERALTIPEKQPAYRKNRSHKDFLINIGVPADKIKKALEKTWQAKGGGFEIPHERIQKLAAEQYANPEWNLKF